MKKKSRKILSVLCCITLAGALVLSGCSADDADSTGDNSDLKVAMVTAAAGANDNGYNQSAVEGLQAAEAEYGVKTHVVDKSEDIPGTLEQLAADGYQLIFSLEYDFEALINGVGGSDPIAKQYPDTTFVVFNDEPNLDEDGNAIHDNVISVLFDVHEASFLAGALSVLVNENADALFGDTHDFTAGDDGRKIGFIGATKSNGITVFSYGFAQGIDYAAEELGVDYTLYTEYNAGFDDSSLGATRAGAYYSEGANIVACVAGSVGDGVTSKAKEVKKLAIEVDADKDDNQPGYIMTSILKNTTVPVQAITKHLVDGTLSTIAGTSISYDLGSGATGITDLTQLEAMVVEDGRETFEEIKAQMDEISAKISDGSIQVVNAQAGETLDFDTLTNLAMTN
ncbi:MAG: BMP family ABC transporter substrate-binding protein [Clostridiales bacterium]|nr:BMP family ABC transporter substrate-binding protein [Clostridiales bacterium]